MVKIDYGQNMFTFPPITFWSHFATVTSCTCRKIKSNDIQDQQNQTQKVFHMLYFYKKASKLSKPNLKNKYMKDRDGNLYLKRRTCSPCLTPSIQFYFLFSYSQKMILVWQKGYKPNTKHLWTFLFKRRSKDCTLTLNNVLYPSHSRIDQQLTTLSFVLHLYNALKRSSQIEHSIF